MSNQEENASAYPELTLYVSDRQHDFFHEELWEQIHLIIARANDRNAD